MLAEDDQPDRDDTDDENDVMHLAELPGKKHDPVKEIMAPACHAKQTWQLGHGDGQAGAGLEAHQDTVADQLHQRAQPQQPGEQAKAGHREGCEARNLRIALRIAVRHRAYRRSYHQRDRRGGSDRELARRTEQRIAQTTQQIAVHADLRRQACECGISERNRDRIGRQRHPGDNVIRQPGHAIIRQPTGRRKPPKPSRCFPAFHRVRHK